MPPHRDVDQLNAELARAYARLADLSRELADEQALTRRLKTVIALMPLNPRRAPPATTPPRRRTIPPPARPRRLVPMWPPPRGADRGR